MLVYLDHEYIHEVIALWNEEAVKDGYKELTEASFSDLFLNHHYFDRENAFVLLDAEQVIGFACGCTGNDLPFGDVSGYVTCIVLSSRYQTTENYNLMLRAIEHRFQSLGKKQAELLFFNPMQLPWYIPNTPKHEHNNAPGVPVDSALYDFLLNQGYVERAIQYAMYLQLDQFTMLEEVKLKEEKVNKAEYHVELFDPDKHSGMEEMLARFDNPLWEKEISQCAADGIPIVVAAYRDKLVGFAGPVICQPNGRGYFAGIGINREHEGHGLGSILFFKLCEAFKSIGTEYMSLYTGRSNPAIRIYEKAGFKTVKTFAVLRKEFY